MATPIHPGHSGPVVSRRILEDSLNRITRAAHSLRAVSAIAMRDGHLTSGSGELSNLHHEDFVSLLDLITGELVAGLADAETVMEVPS